ncbi:bifunctional oligoribonuclease/PAP phosphatase NrnA [uncultured Selenomonas sp.]|uniref:DHH family phosphoesterase n=1 Tax=uncultured Selenomonas sp. TaxID=159275 RepID=UPI0026755258|nr:bifunctional oligoribonuclease/PAP phosphatase NrnA [uncultured Selenomonas sp.]
MKITMDATAQMLRDAQTVVLTSHIRPDGDAIGSTLGLMHVLRAQGKEVRVLIDDEIPRIFSILPGVDQIERPIESQRYTADLLVVCDVELGRTGASVSAVDAVRLLNIDHHVTNDEKAEHLCLNPKAAATCEIVYDLVRILGVMPMLDAAVCLYTGMATDTGFFRFSNTTPHTMRAAADLLEIGVKPNIVSTAMEMKSYDEVMAQVRAIRNLEMFFDGRVAAVFIDEERARGVTTTEGLLDELRVIEGTQVVFFMKWLEKDTYRISMRSKGTNVSRIAQKFDGGGHIRAAGCTIHAPFAEARTAILDAIGGELNA